jgi:Tfp pilus assembly protein PilV
MDWVRRFLRDDKGGVAIIFGLSILPVAGLVGAAVDYNRSSQVRGRLQAAADAAALAAVRAPEANRRQVATNVFRANISGDTIAAANLTQTSLSPDPSRHRVEVRAEVQTSISRVLGVNAVSVSVTAVARMPVATGGGGCFYTLDPGANGALRINGGSQIDAPTCVAHVHSSIPHSFIINAGSRFMVERTCVRGGALLNPGHQTGRVEERCTPDPDPFAGALPNLGVPPCGNNNLVFNPQPGPITLTPGVYCGNTIFNGGSAQVQFAPGLYVIRGPMIFNSGSVVRGAGVTFYFADQGTFMMNGQMSMYLDAPTSGPHARILMFQQPSLPRRNFIFNNEQGQRLSGVIWLPTQDIQFNSRSNGSDADAVTVVANTAILNAQARWRIAPAIAGTTRPAGSPVLEF